MRKKNNNLYTNDSGYYDPTAGKAMTNVYKQERKEARTMAKRSCRRSDDEKLWHDEHVRWSKKTDEQFHKDLEDLKNTQYSFGYNKGKRDGRKEGYEKASAEASPKIDLAAVELELMKVKGLGEGKVRRIMEVISEKVSQSQA